MDAPTFLKCLAEQLALELTANNQIKQLTTNSELVGAFAEASVRELIKRAVAPLRVSRGAIIYEGDCPEGVKELDAVIWSPCPVPAVFERGDFALVPRGSAHGFLEIKRSNYSPELGKKIAERLALQENLNCPRDEELDKHHTFSLGVICIFEHDKKDEELSNLIKQKKTVVLLDREKPSGSVKPNAEAIHQLINFLAAVRMRATRRQDHLLAVNTRILGGFSKSE